MTETLAGIEESGGVDEAEVDDAEAEAEAEVGGEVGKGTKVFGLSCGIVC